MSEHSNPPEQPFDREINVRGIAQSGAWLAAVTIAAFLVAWGYYRLLAHREAGQDAKPSPIAAADEAMTPPGPRLQASPENELAAFRSAEKEQLESWGWEDRAANLAHVPIERAIDAVSEAGALPDFTPMPAGEAAP